MKSGIARWDTRSLPPRRAASAWASRTPAARACPRNGCRGHATHPLTSDGASDEPAFRGPYAASRPCPIPQLDDRTRPPLWPRPQGQALSLGQGQEGAQRRRAPGPRPQRSPATTAARNRPRLTARETRPAPPTSPATGADDWVKQTLQPGFLAAPRRAGSGSIRVRASTHPTATTATSRSAGLRATCDASIGAQDLRWPTCR
jgi:hypothetical protein